MGVDVTVFQADFQSLKDVLGSHDAELFERLAPGLDDSPYDGGNHEDGEEISAIAPREALRQIIYGAVPPDHDGDIAYSHAVAALYSELAGHVGDIQIAYWGFAGFFDEVDAALKAEGFGAYLTDLAYSGPILEVPVGEEPAFGFLSPEVVVALRGRISGHDWMAYAEGIRETIEDLGAWVDHAAADGHGLIAIVS